MERWTQKDLIKLGGMGKGTTQFYLENLFPDKNVGRGKVRHYTNDEVVRFLIASEIKKLGITISVIKSIICKIMET